MQIRARHNGDQRKIKQSNAPSCQANELDLLLCLIRFEFYCNSIASVASAFRAGGTWHFLHLHAPVERCTVRLFVHRAFSLERIKLCGLHQRRMLYGAFWCTTGSLFSVDVHKICGARFIRFICSPLFATILSSYRSDVLSYFLFLMCWAVCVCF